MSGTSSGNERGHPQLVIEARQLRKVYSEGKDVRAALSEAYAGEPFVRVFETGLPELARVQNTNFCDLGVADAYGQVVIVSAIDNLVKGAAGQALQNMNLMLGLDETLGL